ncbi:class IV lanthionine synthetase LanL [Streptomyces sp. NPDC090025]|uniref:class IV lanthionine synthetase LanL n=1 Tax=Streptomyces sp. NPDC090025 TaxID=3365922 RepID=UPI00383465D6
MLAVSIAGRTGGADETWSYLNDPRMPAMEHGWKLHVSARPGELDDVIGLVLPVLARHVCHAKFARDPETLRRLNSGTQSAGAVGKAITVYPADGTVVEVARELAAALRGREGPQVVSDRRVDPAAPVYYRYGPFTGEYRTGRSGRLESVMTGPEGQIFDGLAVGRYRCPPWAEDPFTTGAGQGSGPAGAVGSGTEGSGAGFGGGRYTVTTGITRAATGNVYRAVDRALGRPVVVKQARAYVGEDESGTDARHRLRNEHAVLTALDGVTGVPRALDYFAHGADEYLVMSDCGGRDLRGEVLRDGPFRDGPFRDGPFRDDADRPGAGGPGAGGPGAGGPGALAALAARLLGILDAVHARGVVVRDLKPDNIVLDAAGPGACHLVDFGISERHGAGPGGATPGYGAPVLPASGPAAPADDYYALGATLLFAATGMDPVLVDADRRVNRDRSLDCLAWALPGPAHRDVRATVAGLLSFDPAVRAGAADRLRTGTRPPAGRRPVRPRLDDGLLDEIVAHTTAYCVAEAREMVDPERAARSPVPASVDVYAGSSGLGIELLRHADRPGVGAAVAALARWTAEQPRNLTPAFYTGRTGVEFFLAEAGMGPDVVDGPPLLPERAPDGGPPEADLIAGAAGIGLGRLLLAGHARRAGRPDQADRHLAVATHCAELLASGTARLTVTGPRTAGSAALDEGLAHGEAGVAAFLLEYGVASGDPAAVRRAEQAVARLAAVTPDIVAASAAPGATRRYGSWCRGLAGIGTVLVRASVLLDEPAHLALAARAARACAAVAPRMPLVTQCCGLAGVGELMVDVALASESASSASAPASEEFWAAAGTVALLILSRSGGSWSRPVFPDAGLTRPSAGWAGGSAGVLGFFRRLRDRDGPRLGLLAA